MFTRYLSVSTACCWFALISIAGSVISQTHAESPPDAFPNNVQPLLSKYCLRCHDAEKMESGIRLDRLSATLQDEQLFLCEEIVEQLSNEAMPPEDQPQPSPQQRDTLLRWFRGVIETAKSRQPQKHGSIRRLTIAQYRNTLRDLLGLKEDLTEVLPPDGLSKDGFLNNESTMLLSPLLIEAYFDVAEKALDRCLVDESSTPTIQNFRVELGKSINQEPCPDKLILGANSHLLANDDFRVRQLKPDKPFAYQPLLMQTKFRFIEGYQGNATVRGWREYDSIYHAVFACMRGTDGYPKGKAYDTVPEGLLLRPAIPSSELFGQSSTYGPRANFKISLRELPDDGNFRVTVRAARYEDALLLGKNIQPRAETKTNVVVDLLAETDQVDFAQPGIYQVDVYLNDESDPSGESPPREKPQELLLSLGERNFSRRLDQSAFLAVRLPSGPLDVNARYRGKIPLKRIVFTPLDESDPVAQEFLRFEQRTPRLGVHLGLRRDCGSTLTRVGEPREVSSTKLHDFVFSGAINDFPTPDVEENNVNYLAGVREIGVRSEYTDGRDMPRLWIRSVEFEGPFYETWPPRSHRNIFIPSNHRNDSARYASEIIDHFATKAFRRQPTEDEKKSLLAIWKSSYAEKRDLQQSIKDTLLVILTSPQFLFLIEDSQGPQAEPLDPYELASKLSYFLWNTMPDARLLELAAAGELRASLDTEIDRMIADERFDQFIEPFTSQWLSLDKFDVVEIDRKRFPTLTRDTKTELRKEPIQFFRYLIKQNLPLAKLIDSEFVVANEVVANYYDLPVQPECGFRFVPIPHRSEHLGGVLTQAAILSGLSDGRESNPVKRGAWLARKIIAEPPDDPPPNVPELPDDDGEDLTLREKLQRHRDQKGSAKCHAGIDPWGIPFEQFNAAGLLKKESVDPSSTLPDNTEVADLNELKKYLADQHIDGVAFSFLKHLATYANGRSLHYNEIEFLKRERIQLKGDGYLVQDMLRFVIHSKLFLEK